MDYYPTKEDMIIVNQLWRKCKMRTKRELIKQLKEDLCEYEQWSCVSFYTPISNLRDVDELLEFLGDKNMLNERGLRFREGFYKKYKNKMYPSHLPSIDGSNKKILYRRRKR